MQNMKIMCVIVVNSQAAFVFYFKFRAKSNLIIDSVSFYITEVCFACCQDRIIPSHTLKWEIQDGHNIIMKRYKCSYLCNQLR